MALDPSDLCGPPFSFGECKEYRLNIYPKCQAWGDTEDFTAPMFIRREGKFVRIVIPEIMKKANGQGTKDIIQFNLDFLSDIEKEEVLGKDPHSMRFLAGGLNGVVSNEDGSTVEIIFCTVDMDFQGNFYIAPENDDEGFCTLATTKPIGLFSFSFVYEVDDWVEEKMEEEEEEEEEEIIEIEEEEVFVPEYDSDYADEPVDKEAKLDETEL